MRQIEKRTAKFYSEKIKKFGNNYKGVGWKSKKDQYIRFEQLICFFDINNSTIHDFGCGNGEFLNFLKKKKIKFKNYLGTDIYKNIINICKKKYGYNKKFSFQNLNIDKIPNYDFIIASGIFNIKNNIAIKEWEKYFYSSITKMYQKSKKGLSFNLLTFDTTFKNPKNFYPDLVNLIKFIRKKLTKKIVINHSYRLWEYTVYLYK